MIDNVFELTNLERSGVLDVTVDGVSVVHSGNVAEVPAIDNVTQTDTSTDADYRVLLSNSANSTTETAGVGKSNGLLYNPSAKQLIVRNPNFSTYMTMTEPNIGIYQKSNPNSYWGGMRITARDITLEGKISDGSSVDQTWDGANTSLKSAISSVVLSGTSEPTSSDGRNNSLYVKYNNEVLVPTFTPLLHYTNNLNVNFTQHEKVRIVIDTSIDPQYPNYHFDAVLDINDSPSGSYVELACYDEQLQEHVILGQINFTESTYLIGSRIGSTNVDINQTLTIYDDVSKIMDNIYFKTDNAWIKDNFKEEITTDITNLTTTVNTLIRTSAPGVYSEGATMAAGAITEDVCAVDNITGYTPIGIIGSFADCTDTSVQVMVFNEHLTSNGVSYKLMNVGGAFSNKNIQVEFKVLYKKNSQ